MKSFTDMLLFFLLVATTQNLILTTGLGASSMIKLVRRPKQLFRFGSLLLVFSVLPTAWFFPIDRFLLPDTWFARMIRPFILLVLTGLLYLGCTAYLSRSKEQYRPLRSVLPLAAFNNVVIGVSLLINYQVSVSFFPAIGIAAGGAVGFVLLSALTAEAVERLDNPDIPRAFRGLPATLVYLGLLALALMGFKTKLNFI